MLIYLLQELSLIGLGGYRHAHEACGQPDVGDDTRVFLMEVQEVASIEVEHRRPDLPEG